MESPRRNLRNLPKVDYTLTGLRTLSSSTTASSGSSTSPRKTPKPRPSTPYGSANRKSRTRRSPVPEVGSDDDYGVSHLSEITTTSLNKKNIHNLNNVNNNKFGNSAIRSRFPAKSKTVFAESPPRGLFDRLQIGPTDSPIHLGGRLAMRNSMATFSPSRLFRPSTPLKPASGFDEEFEEVRAVDDDADFVVYDDEEEEEGDDFFNDPNWHEEEEELEVEGSDSETEVIRNLGVASELGPIERSDDEEDEGTAVDPVDDFHSLTFNQDQLWSTITSFLWLVAKVVYSVGVASLGIFFRLFRLVIELAVTNSTSLASRIGPKALSGVHWVMQSLVRPSAMGAGRVSNLTSAAVKGTTGLVSRTFARLRKNIGEGSARMAKSALSMCNVSDPAKMVRMLIGFALLVMIASMLLHARGATRPSPQKERTIFGRLKLILPEIQWPSIRLPKISPHPDQASQSSAVSPIESLIPPETHEEPNDSPSGSKQEIPDEPAPDYAKISNLEKEFADFRASKSVVGSNGHVRIVLDRFLEELRSVRSDLQDVSVGTSKAKREVDEKLSRLFSMMDGFRSKLETQHDKVAGMVEEQIRSLIPQYMVARVDPKTGKVELDPSFYESLKTIHFESQTINSSASWDAFVQSNSKAVASLIDDRVAGSLNAMAKNGKIISREETVAILRQNFRQLIEEHPPSNDGKDAGGTSGSAFTEESITELVKKLVDGALKRYQSETQSLVDYALVSNGARVISLSTSETYHPPRPKTNWINRSLSYLTGMVPTRRGKPPTTALSPDVQVGNCWPLAGSKGYLTVQILKPIHPTDFTVDHVPPSPLSDPTSAPKDIEVWAAFKRKELNPESLPNFSAPSSNSDDRSLSQKNHQSLKNDYVYVFLARHVFNVHDEKPSQTFPVNVAVKPLLRKLPPVHTVQLRIASNHGNEQYTCLYRFRVHGKPAEDSS